MACARPSAKWTSCSPRDAPDLLRSGDRIVHTLRLVEKAELIWKNGEFVPWDEANVHVLTHGLHYGTGVFEGIRCYDTEIGPAIFRHQDHRDRLAKSAELYYLPL